MLEQIKPLAIAFWRTRHRVDSLLTYLAVSVAILLGAFLFGARQLPWQAWIALLLLLWGAGLVLFFDARRIPRAPRGKCVVAVAMRFGAGADRTTIKEDFLDELKKLLRRAHPNTLLTLIEVPEFYCEQIDGAMTVDEVASRCGAHLMILGSVKPRKSKAGESVHVLELDSIVAHGSSHPSANQLLTAEIRDTFPRHLEIPKDGAHIVFGQTASEVVVASRYILGTAALITGDLEFASAQYADAQRSLGSLDGSSALRSMLAEKLFQRSQDCLLGEMHLSYHLWIKEGNNAAGGKIAYAYSQLSQDWKRRSSVRLLYAAGLFIQKPSSIDARNIVKRLCAEGLVEARISQAFLRSYDANFAGLRESYRSAIVGKANERAWASATSFTARAIELYPDHPYLLYALALIREHVDHDVDGAIRLYEKFSTVVSLFAPEHANAAMQRVYQLRRAHPPVSEFGQS